MTEITTIGVVGAGVIGLSWTALFLLQGHDVYLYDIRENFEAAAEEKIKRMVIDNEGDWASLREGLTLTRELADFTDTVTYIQECATENLALKQQLLQELEAFVAPDCVIASSSSSLVPSLSGAELTRPERFLVAHPFNPPHIMPLVEVVPSPQTTPATIDLALAFYRQLGKHPVYIKKEMTGFVANRLAMAIFQEAVFLVKEKVVTAQEVDEVIENSIGIRWAIDGPYKSYHLGAGEAGFRGFMKHFRPMVQNFFDELQHVTLTDEMVEMLIQETEKYGQDYRQMEQRRDQFQKQFIGLLKED